MLTVLEEKCSTSPARSDRSTGDGVRAQPASFGASSHGCTQLRGHVCSSKSHASSRPVSSAHAPTVISMSTSSAYQAAWSSRRHVSTACAATSRTVTAAETSWSTCASREGDARRADMSCGRACSGFEIAIITTNAARSILDRCAQSTEVSDSGRVLTHCSNLGKPGLHVLTPHSNPVVPYYAAGRDPSWYLADEPPNCSHTVTAPWWMSGGSTGVVARTV